MTISEALAERFWAKVQRGEADACWLWRGSKVTKGYGRFGVGGRSVGAHRVAYELLVGPIPEGLTLDHLCRVRACVNPAHLEPVTNRENVLRGVGISAKHARKTHCNHGHELTPENTETNGNHRRCVTCRRKRDEKRRAATQPANPKLKSAQASLDALRSGTPCPRCGKPVRKCNLGRHLAGCNEVADVF
jgi:HNH endonuclease